MAPAIHLGTVELLGTRHLGTAELLGTRHLGVIEIDGLTAAAPDAISGAAAGTGDATADATLDQTVQGGASGSGDAAGDAVLDQAIGGDATGAGDAAADATLTNDQAISGAAAAAGDAAADATLDQTAQGDAVGAGDGAANAGLDQSLSGDAAGAGDAAADVTADGDQALSGDAVGTGDASSAADLDQTLSGDATGTGDADADAGLDQAVSGDAAGAGDAAAGASLDQSIAGSAAGAGDAAGDATVSGGAALPLDGVTVYAAWSAARRLATSYTGNLIRVRRSSDDAELDIGYDGANELDASALSAFVGSNSAYIVTYYDQIGTANLSQATPANQPRIVNAGTTDTVGGKPTMVFDGVNDNLNHEFGHDIFAGGASTFIAVHALSAAANKAVMAEARTATASVNYLAMIESGGTASAFIRLNSGSVVFNGPDLAAGAFDGTPHCLSVTWDGTNLNGFLDGVAGASAAPSNTSPHAPDRLTLGAHSDGTNLYNLAAGPITEIVIAKTELSSGDRGAVETDAISFYGI